MIVSCNQFLWRHDACIIIAVLIPSSADHPYESAQQREPPQGPPNITIYMLLK